MLHGRRWSFPALAIPLAPLLIGGALSNPLGAAFSLLVSGLSGNGSKATSDELCSNKMSRKNELIG
jgi:hypothetical protein